MTTELDLPTVLFLQKTSYIAGALTLGYLRLTSTESRGAGLLASGFLVLAAGSTLAGYAELYPEFYGFLSLINIALAVLGYCLSGLAFVLISDRERKLHTWLVILPAAGTVVAGVITDFHLNNTCRATTFNLFGALTMAAAAWTVYRDASREPLPVRKLVVGILSAASLLSLIMGIEFFFNTFPVIGVVEGFSLMILSKFVLAIAIVIFISERQHLKIKYLADHDPLTELYNRRSFNANAPDEPQPGDAVLFLDLDHFKHLNDRFGHAAGDQVLSMMAQAVKAILPPSALFARQGGEEFVVFLPAGAGDAVFHAERIRKTMADLRFSTIGPGITVTISVGVSRSSQQGIKLSDLCREADRALYSAKAGGRNRVCYADRNTHGENLVGSAANFSFI
jgi:diguanylate cyclase (GGDEF)-like protein